jgi:hypothetical protein
MISYSHWGMFAVESYEGKQCLHCGKTRKTAHLIWLDDI